MKSLPMEVINFFLLIKFGSKLDLHNPIPKTKEHTMITQQQSQRQQLKILPQQIQLLNLYFLNSLELEQRIRNELAENPFLETQEEKTVDEGENRNSSKDSVRDF